MNPYKVVGRATQPGQRMLINHKVTQPSESKTLEHIEHCMSRRNYWPTKGTKYENKNQNVINQ